MEVFLCTLCVQYLCARSGFDVDTSHSFPQCVLATVTLVGNVVDGGSKACIGCEAGLLFCSVAVLPSQG